MNNTWRTKYPKYESPNAKGLESSQRKTKKNVGSKPEQMLNNTWELKAMKLATNHSHRCKY
ncbi:MULTISPECIES: hypothetical protein [unclassified Enterococcus]|uniref:hypothetical protein n=1 Tax=unclassified Enterococcus TaxID=2608891 RepID=UPI001CE04536|nr:MULTISPECIES: hypothetical protein [unclassified Enterococcus]MCA5013606.1 hypothetical protein [Enterococcus sp. S23]MCA5016856.1 hypothetical protein [Enterococcus sp. S22(2020)]